MDARDNNLSHGTRFKSGEKNLAWKGGKSKIVCKQCGKVFYDDRSSKRKFCDKKCDIKYKKGRPVDRHNWTGELNPKWKGGISKEKEIVRKSIKYKQWRQQVFIRDNFTCQSCGHKSGNDIIVHHIKHFSVLLQEVKEYMPLIHFNEAILLYTPLWDISNGVVICRRCHEKEHKNN